MEKTRRNPISAIGRWFRGTVSELKRVVWPSFKKIRQNTLIVLVFILIVGAIIALLDLGFATLMQAIQNLFAA